MTTFVIIGIIGSLITLVAWGFLVVSGLQSINAYFRQKLAELERSRNHVAELYVTVTPGAFQRAMEAINNLPSPSPRDH